MVTCPACDPVHLKAYQVKTSEVKFLSHVIFLANAHKLLTTALTHYTDVLRIYTWTGKQVTAELEFSPINHSL